MSLHKDLHAAFHVRAFHNLSGSLQIKHIPFTPFLKKKTPSIEVYPRFPKSSLSKKNFMACYIDLNYLKFYLMWCL